MDTIARVAELMQKRETFCLATVVESADPKISAGRKVIVRPNGLIEGGIDAASMDSKIRDSAMNAIRRNKKQTVEISNGVRIFTDVLSEQIRLLVCGAGHIAMPLARFAREVGFEVTVLDDREDFANQTRFPDCAIVTDDFVTALREMPLGASTYVVIITRGHEHDSDCLGEILQKETAYVGLIGSRRRVHFVLKNLESTGISQRRLRDVFTPIGLPIGAETPEEIALSIISELVCVRRRGAPQARVMRDAVGVNL